MITHARDNLLAFLRRSFFTGLLVVLPSCVSLYLCWLGFDAIDRALRWTMQGLPVEPMRGTGFVLGAVGVITIGALAQNFLGKRVVDLYHWLFEQLPVVSHLQGALRKIMELVLSDDARAFQEVVLIEYPRPGSYALAFLAAPTPARIAAKTPFPELVSVFVPTTPNPTSGFLLMLPREEVQVLDIPPEEGLKLIVSGGLLVPEELKAKPVEQLAAQG